MTICCEIENISSMNLNFRPKPQVAESHIDSVLNARHKKTGKMQWSREGAHNVLQIRAEIISKGWPEQWQGAVLSALGAVA